MGLMCVLAGASPVAAAPIEIDATQLVYRYFIIPGVTPQWLESRSTVRTLNLPTGRYHFQFASGYYADFSFDVSGPGHRGLRPGVRTSSSRAAGPPG